MLSAFICLVSRKARKGAKTQRFMFCFEQRLWWSEVDFFLFRAKLAREQRRKVFYKKMPLIGKYFQPFELHVRVEDFQPLQYQNLINLKNLPNPYNLPNLFKNLFKKT
jgi:hypothetical protein